MKSSLKTILFISVYSLVLYAIYQMANRDILLMFLTFSLMIPLVYLLNDRYKQQQHIAHLHEETLKSELNLLKSQINPHFFFNTLNNLYGLAAEKSEHTQEVIYKLSQMMRFTIYEGRKNTVTITDEVEYLENFIELNVIRYKNKLDINFEKNIEDSQQRIPPLLFINLLENAFKHGVDSQLEHQYILFSLQTSKTKITFTIENNFDKSVHDKNKAKRAFGGLGTENLSRRLTLLFPKKHQYTRLIEDNRYIAKVMIDLT
ncbi:sensor histidine kinase [Cognaticolwellia mytili]|uniref:sensor histidine kinase n=1 Tax=Cognaticolwellia mytili TaxID=1888913 RepID=UPI000A16F1F7|nr:histidine kinase [Cognaticolwellia mytili]